ncbi:MAG: SMI1/KNR4 family protein [Agarilytica sp.]
MEEVIEFLQENSQSVSMPLELPTEDELVCIEEEILISLPHDLRKYLLEASDAIIGALEPVTAADPRSHTYLPEVTARAWDIGLPREYIPVCEYNGGYACIAEDGKVFFWDGQALTIEWEDFWMWCKDVWLADVDR